MGEEAARLLLLLLFAAAFVNVTRGTFRTWLHAKFIGTPSSSFAAGAPAAATSRSPNVLKTPAAALRRPAPAPKRDLAVLTASDRFSSPAIAAAARRYAPAGQIPHMVANEGTPFVGKDGRRYVMVKYEDPRGGSNTIPVPIG